MNLARLTATLVAALVLAACSSDPEPKVEPSESPSSSSVSTSEPPEALDPEETVRAWVDARNVLMLQGDAAPVERLSANECRTCRLSIEPVKVVIRDGGHFETSGWRVSKSRVRSETVDAAVVRIDLVIPGGRTIPAAGAEPVLYVEQKRMLLVTTSATGAGWLVSKLVYLS
jgi:hypothetical protein